MIKTINFIIVKFLVIFIILGVFSKNSFSQSVSFELKTSPSISFLFNDISDYLNGITYMNAVTLNIEATGTQWDLYVGAKTTVPNQWDVISTYSSSGIAPTVDMVKIQFRNANNTSLVSGFFTLTDISTPVYVIGSSLKPDIAVNCPGSGTNTAGSYLTNPQCYQFKVDLKITPGLVPGSIYQSGLYYLQIDYIISGDL
ncbi:MAG: hypothetical protein K9J13_17215 [Saprospiraceae bacterium]|nr:hypothetical protein [Saprospiraceae bacterium]